MKPYIAPNQAGLDLINAFKDKHQWESYRYHESKGENVQAALAYLTKTPQLWPQEWEFNKFDPELSTQARLVAAGAFYLWEVERVEGYLDSIPHDSAFAYTEGDDLRVLHKMVENDLRPKVEMIADMIVLLDHPHNPALKPYDP